MYPIVILTLFLLILFISFANQIGGRGIGVCMSVTIRYVSNNNKI